MKNHVYDYIILGAGITGISSGRILQQKNNNNFLIIEEQPTIGGLCRTKKIDDHYLDLGGGHVLHSSYPYVLDWIFSHIPKEDFNKFDTKVLIDLEGNQVEFPIELNLWRLPTDLQVEYVLSYINAGSKNESFTDFESWITNKLGEKIANNYMIPYNKKLWCHDISELNTDWLSKIPRTDSKLVLKTIIEKSSNFDSSVVSHSSFYYPKYGGFQSIIDSIYNKISENVKVGVKVQALRYCNQSKLWYVNEEFVARKIINTIPWTSFEVKLNDFSFKEHKKHLQVLSNVISLWEKEYDHDAHWKYIPDPNVDQHREFYIHNFAPYSKKNGVMTDINYKRYCQNGMKWKDGVPLYEHVNHYSYPLPTLTYKKHIFEILNYCKDYNLFGLGRWGMWKYFNIDQCIKQSMDFFDESKQFNYDEIF